MFSCRWQQQSWFTARSAVAWALVALVMVLPGCQQRTASRLSGKWVGRPDTAEARAAREAEKYGDALPTDAAPTGDTTLAANRPPPTDWEQYDAAVTFNFVSREELRMSLAGQAEEVVAEWEIAETLPTGCLIDVVTPAAKATGTDAEGTTPREQTRRFKLEFNERDGKLRGFLLSEVGADRQLGALYFQRPSENRGYP